MLEDEKSHTSENSDLPFKKSLKHYKKAIFWSFFIFTTIMMDGYDGALIGGFLEHPFFRETYGTKQKNGDYSINALWSIILSIGSPLGRILGVYVIGFIHIIIGRKLSMIISLILIFFILFIVFFANSIILLSFGLMLCGIMSGVFYTLVQTYMTDCPLVVRKIMIIYIYLCCVIGQGIAHTVMFVLKDNKTEWSYRIPFGLQWICPLILLISVPFSPESPYWLVRKGKHKEVEKSIRGLLSELTDEEIIRIISNLEVTIEREKAIQYEAKYLDCFKGSDLYRTEIASLSMSIQVLTGNVILNLAPYYFGKMGLSSNHAFTMAFLLSILGLIGTIISWFLTIGLRKNYLFGTAFLGFIQLLIAILDLTKSSIIFSWIQVAMILLWALVYNLTIGPCCYTIVFGTPSKRLKEKTIVLSTILYSIVSLFFQFVTLLMLNQDIISGKIGFLYGTTCAISCVYCFFRIPELKNRSYSEMKVLFEKGINCRDMESYVVTEEDTMLYH